MISIQIDVDAESVGEFRALVETIAKAHVASMGAGPQESRPIALTITQAFHGQVDSAAIESAARNGLLDAMRGGVGYGTVCGAG